MRCRNSNNVAMDMDFRRVMKQAPRFQLTVGIAELAITTIAFSVALVTWNTVALPGGAGRSR